MSAIQYFDFKEPFDLEQGGRLPGFRLAYSTFGELNKDRTNVVWVCHALTANSNVLDWWPGLFEKGSALDTEKYFIICANMLGGCYGSTGPLSIDPNSGEPFYHDFPRITNLDNARAFDLLREHLNIDQVHTVIGGSMGGQQALEWSIIRPEIFTNLVGLATNARHSPWGIAFNETQRLAIEGDPSWQTRDPDAGSVGMKTARAVALMSYRSYPIYEIKQQDADDRYHSFRSAFYQQYQGDKLRNRFNAFTYWYLSHAMDAHNLGRNRGGIKKALDNLQSHCHFIGIESDLLFPVEEQVFLQENISGATLSIISSDYGHDGFLVETEKIDRILKDSGAF